MADTRIRSVEIRRPLPDQGRALEVLGHAIEYLMDSYVIHRAGDGSRNDRRCRTDRHTPQHNSLSRMPSAHPSTPVDEGTYLSVA
jgi:hypothetical protein